jgi:AraC-like DNA-binding protein
MSASYVSQTRTAHGTTIDASESLDAELATTSQVGRVGDITLIDVTFHTATILSFDDVGESYHVHLPVAGRLESSHRGIELLAARDTAAVYQPNGGPMRGRWASGTRSLSIVVPQASVMRALGNLLGERPAAAIRFDETMRTADTRARSWVNLMAQFSRDLATEDGLLSQPAMAAPIAESLVTGFLFAVGHSYADELARSTPAPRPRAIRTAVELMHGDPAHPWTLALLADKSAVSVRTLQAGFRDHLGTSPMAYLRSVRLDRAHQELSTVDPDSDSNSDSVADIARRWGFYHLGRFAAAHEARFGELPSHTLSSATRPVRRPPRG